MSTNAPAVADPKMADFRGMLARMKPQFEMALPRHMTADRLMRISITACQKNPKLLDCTPKSVFAALMTAAQLGIEPDGTLGRAYMIPRKNNKAGGILEANFQLGYQGLLELLYRTGEIVSVRADVVRKGDFFVTEKGLNEKLEHREGKDNFDAEITNVYAIIRTKSGGVFWDQWPAAKVEAHRRRFSKDGREDSVWNTDWASMAKKTLLIAVMHYAPKSVESARAVEADERGELDLPEGVIDVAPAKAEQPASVADLRDSGEGDGTSEPGAGPPNAAGMEPSPPPPSSAIPPRRRANRATAAMAAQAQERPLTPEENMRAQAGAATLPSAEKTLEQQLYAEINMFRTMVTPELFDALIKKHGGEKAEKFYGLGTDGQRNLRDELQKAIGP